VPAAGDAPTEGLAPIDADADGLTPAEDEGLADAGPGDVAAAAAVGVGPSVEVGVACAVPGAVCPPAVAVGSAAVDVVDEHPKSRATMTKVEPADLTRGSLTGDATGPVAAER